MRQMWRMTCCEIWCLIYAITSYSMLLGIAKTRAVAHVPMSSGRIGISSMEPSSRAQAHQGYLGSGIAS